MDKKEPPPILREDLVSEETKTLISSLPSVGKLCNYQGSWYYPNTLQGVLNFQAGFTPQDDDIILASFPKSGTTWLKALTIAILERSKDPSHDHPLLSDNPHGIVPCFEFNLYFKSSKPDLTKFSSSSPRLFSTHMPLQTLQVPFKDTPCKIVYVCRNLKDVLVSHWYFLCVNVGKEVDSGLTLESMFESFCSGVLFFGSYWDHVLSYWKKSLEDPMRFEELKTKPHEQIKRLAEFLGCPFSEEEEENGFLDKILELCSLRNLSGLEVNKTRKTMHNIHYHSFFRKGEIGDWKNHLTTEMENKIDMIIKEKFHGSGLKI